MQAADLGDSQDGTERQRLDAPRDRSIPLQREMGTRDVVVVKVPFAEDDQVVQAFAPDRANDSLGVGVLPGGLRSGDGLLYAQPCYPATERIAVDGVTISEQVSGLGPFSREGFDDLACGPLGGGMGGDVEVKDASGLLPRRGKYLATVASAKS